VVAGTCVSCDWTSTKGSNTTPDRTAPEAPSVACARAGRAGSLVAPGALRRGRGRAAGRRTWEAARAREAMAARHALAQPLLGAPEVKNLVGQGGTPRKALGARSLLLSLVLPWVRGLHSGAVSAPPPLSCVGVPRQWLTAGEPTNS